MLLTTRGIVFNQVKYGESSIITKIYTEQLGLQTYMVRGVRSKNSRIRSAHLQHLTLVEIEVNQRANKEIQHLKGLKIDYPFRDIPLNIRKSTVVVFLNELLNKVIREEESNPDLFRFLHDAIQLLDIRTGNLGLFHHLFLIRLTGYLGFFPQNNFSAHRMNFDLQEGQFTSIDGPESLIAKPPVSALLNELLIVNFEDLEKLKVQPHARNAMLEMLMRYYQLHVPGFGNLKSYAILSEVFGN